MSGEPPAAGLGSYLGELRRQLAAQFGVAEAHDGIERIVEEAQAHLEDAIAEGVAKGHSPEDATVEALFRFGSVRDLCRAYCALPSPRFVTPPTASFNPHRTRTQPEETTMSSRFRDLRYAFRNLMSAPVYTLAFVLTLGLGIGANTAIFSVVNGVLLNPLPHRDGDRLVYVRHSARLAGIDNALFSVPEIDDYRRGVPSFDGVAEFSALTFTLLGLDEPRRVTSGIVTGNYFEVMGLQATLGRTLVPDDDGESAVAAAVLTDHYWRGTFGADPSVLGRRVEINNKSVEIVGVLEPAPPYPERTDILVNMATSPHHLGASMSHDRLHRMTEVFARLAPGAEVEQARREVEEITAILHAEYPEAYEVSQGYGVAVTPLYEQLTRNARPTVLLLLGVAAFVLVIACANVANLTLARVLRRQEELAVRLALGAAHGRLRRQLLIENLIPAVAGATIGILLAYGGLGALVAYISRYTSRAAEISLDGRVFLAALLAGIGAAVVCAFIPRLPDALAARPGSGPSGQRGTAGTAGRRLQRILVVSQIGICFVLLIGAGLLLRTLFNLRQENGGVRLDEVLSLEIPHSLRGDDARTYARTVLDRVSVLPGVRSAAFSNFVPLRQVPEGLAGILAAMRFSIDGLTPEPGAPEPRADFRQVSDGYFHTLDVSLVRGRFFTATDTAESAPVVIINQTMAEHYFPGRDPMGQRLAWTDDVTRFLKIDNGWREVVGVVADTRDYGVEHAAPHVIYHPLEQSPGPYALFVRTSRPSAVTTPVIGILRELDAQQPIVNIATLEQVRSESIAPQRLNATLVGVFAVLALMIAAIGVAGVLAFMVSQRQRELGIRAALGADRRRLMLQVLREGAGLAAVGLVLGAGVALALTRLMDRLLFEVDPTDLMTFVIVALVLTATALSASLLPAWRAARIDPVETLRAE